MERLDKFISTQSVMSRKDIHKLIWTGHVSVNDRAETKIDRKIDSEKDVIKIDGKVLEYKKYVYIMLNKPCGVISAASDKAAETVIDLIPDELRRKNLAPVGRLDKDTTGLLIITDDGDFSHKVTAPGKNVFKTYLAMLDGEISTADKEKLESGITIDGGEKCKRAFVKTADKEQCLYEISICEGKYHQVKRMFAAVGRHVLTLKRISVGKLYLDDSLSEGESRELTENEKQFIFFDTHDI